MLCLIVSIRTSAQASGFSDWAADITALAALPNTVVKISGGPQQFGGPLWTPEVRGGRTCCGHPLLAAAPLHTTHPMQAVEPYVQHCIKAFVTSDDRVTIA